MNSNDNKNEVKIEIGEQFRPEIEGAMTMSDVYKIKIPNSEHEEPFPDDFSPIVVKYTRILSAGKWRFRGFRSLWNDLKHTLRTYRDLFFVRDQVEKVEKLMALTYSGEFLATPLSVESFKGIGIIIEKVIEAPKTEKKHESV